MQIIEVSNRKHRRWFLNMVDDIYRDDDCYVRPLDVMIEEVFDRQKNPLLEKGTAVRFLLLGEHSKVVGRIAAFVHPVKAFRFNQPTGGVGFFECINDMQAAFMLFNAAKEWLILQGMKAMDGPINFGENDNFWGLLVQGYTQPGFGMQYNPPYYRALFESYGFRLYYEQITNHLNVVKPFPDRFWRIAERVLGKPGLSFRHFTWKERDRFIADFIEVYNDAWQFHENYTPMQEQHLRNLLEKARPFLLEEFIWFAYFDNQPIAFLVMFGDGNQILKHMHGKMHWINKLRFAWYRYRKTITRTRVTVMGVKPEFQRMGIESALFYQYRDVVKRYPHITEFELSWVGDFNPKMRALEEAMGSTLGKKHLTYRYHFSPDQDVSARSPIIPMDTKEWLNKDGD